MWVLENSFTLIPCSTWLFDLGFRPLQPIWPYLFKSLFLFLKKKHFFHWYQKFAYRLHKEQNITAKEDWFLHFCRCRCSRKSCHLSCYNWTYYVLICHCYFDNNKNVILTNKSSFLMHNHHHFCEKKNDISPLMD